MMNSDQAITVLTRRCFMLQGRVTRHETQNGKPAFFDRSEMRAINRALLAMGVDYINLPLIPEIVLGEMAEKSAEESADARCAAWVVTL